MRRAGVSIAANIVEGCGRNTDRELARFVRIAIGSASELETLALLARDLGFMDNIVHQSLSAEVIEVRRMLLGLLEKLRSRES